MTYALTDLSNLDPGAFGDATFQVAASNPTDRSLTERSGELPSVFDWDGANFLQRAQRGTDALAAAGGGRLLIPAGAHAVNTTTDGTWTITGSNIEIVSPARRAASITFSGSGPHIVIGGDANTQTQEIGFRGLRLSGAAGQTLIKTRNLRGLRFYDTGIVADRFLNLGDASLTSAHTTYIVELYDGCELSHIASPSLHFVKAENFLGQFVSVDTFCEGRYVEGLDGFNSNGNLVDLEHGIVTGGYWSRFDVNWSFKGGRPAGWFFSHHFSEGAQSNAFLFEAGEDGVHVGWNNIFIADTVVDSVDEAIVFRTAKTGVTGQNVQVSNITRLGASAGKSVVLVDAQLGTLQNVQISDIAGQITPADASQDFVHVKGSSSAATLRYVQIGNINGSSTSANTLNSVLHIEGTQNVGVQQTGQVTGLNIAAFVIDDSAVASRTPSSVYRLDTTQSFGSIPAGGSVSVTAALAGVRPAKTMLIGNVRTGSVPVGVVMTYSVPANDTVNITASNVTGAALTANSIKFQLKAENYN